ncbi:MAG: DUF364 domain-containing protein [Holophagales bacterium]|nr:DUF364 domain-containing protein [Holophagales bacterium]
MTVKSEEPGRGARGGGGQRPAVAEVLLGAFGEVGGGRWTLERVSAGRRWLLAEVRGENGRRAGGLASHRSGEHGPSSAGELSELAGASLPALEAARLVTSPKPLRAAIGLATMNAVFADAHGAGKVPGDGVDWLLAAGRGRHVAIVGRFPFIEKELRPAVDELTVFELEPRTGELGPEAMAEILPRADVVTITASTLLNHTLDGMLAHLPTAGQVLLLGPSTPLCPALFALGIHLLSGIVVTDLEKARRDVEAGVTFRHLGGTRRVTLEVGAEPLTDHGRVEPQADAPPDSKPS